MGDLSEMRDLFAIPLKLLRVPQENRGPQFDNQTIVDLIISERKSTSFLKGPYSRHYWPKTCVNSLRRFR